MTLQYFTCLILIAQSPVEVHEPCTVRTTIILDIADVRFDKVAGYDAVYVKGSGTTQHPGMPMLPAMGVAIAIPVGTRVSRFESRVVETHEFPGIFRLLPEQEPRPARSTEGQEFTMPDAMTYGSPDRYPGKLAELEKEGCVAGQPIVWVVVYPVQYIPAAGKLFLHNAIELTLYCCRDEGKNDKGLEGIFGLTESQQRLYAELASKLVNNPELVVINPEQGTPSLFLPAGEFDHVVITGDNLAAAFGPLIYWHTKKGLRDTTVTTEWIYANYPGLDDTLQIRQFIVDANATWGTSYFLIGGEYETVPCAWRLYYNESTPSDQYYSDYNDDWIHEVFIGRVATSSASEVSRFVDKLLLYEKTPPLIDYPLEVCLCGMDMDANTHGELLMEQIASYLPVQFTANKVYDSHATNHRTAFLNNLNAGQNIVGHCDHGETELMAAGWFNHYGFIHNVDVDLLNNDSRLSNVVSIGCKTTALDHSDCIAEHFVVYNDLQAGVSYTGNTRDGYYSSGNPFALSLELCDWWWNGLFVLDQDDLGRALVNSKHRFPTQDNALREHCEWTFNLLGDPAMPVWTDQPDSMLVVHDGTVPACTSDFVVSVTESDGVTPVAGAMVCCWIPEQVPAPLYARAHTDSCGVAILKIAPTTAGDTMEITVTEHNYLPCEGKAVIVPATGTNEQHGHAGWIGNTKLSVFPNPFKGTVTVNYALKRTARTQIEIYSAAGCKVWEISIKPYGNAGTIQWNGHDRNGRRLPDGVYFLKFQEDIGNKAVKIILAR